jgi:hypothetical protein
MNTSDRSIPHDQYLLAFTLGVMTTAFLAPVVLYAMAIRALSKPRPSEPWSSAPHSRPGPTFTPEESGVSRDIFEQFGPMVPTCTPEDKEAFRKAVRERFGDLLPIRGSR